LSRLDIEAVALEMNSDNVELGRRLGDPVYYADATSEEALGHAHVETCRAIVIMINDNQAIERVISTIGRMKVQAPVFVPHSIHAWIGTTQQSHTGQCGRI
jgi:CPA2 family monovalent cation:H+ antiporter-2